MPVVGQRIVAAPVPTPPPSPSPPEAPLTHYWATSDGKTVRLYLGNVTDVLARLPEKSVHCVVTSPPYWGLRDYGTASWGGGDENCDHKPIVAPRSERPRKGLTGGTTTVDVGTIVKGDCPRCGAKRIDQQLGSEPSPDCGTQGKAQCGKCFVCAMVAVFRGVYRVLRDDGTLWLNLGDSYASRTDGSTGGIDDALDLLNGESRAKRQTDRPTREDKPKSGLKSGNLVGVPWRVALALQADGWILRQDIVWHKPSPMPESVRNRCTKAHEYVFLLAKRTGYFYDAEAIKEPNKDMLIPQTEARRLARMNRPIGSVPGGGQTSKGLQGQTEGPAGSISANTKSNKRSVWTVSSYGYPGAHFATFPPSLIEPMIKAGTSGEGCCEDCGAPWKRVTEETKLTRERPNDYVKRTGEEGTGNSCPNSVAGVESKTVGWKPTCECSRVEIGEDGDTEHVVPAPAVPCTVLDPFIGSGTTCVVSLGLGRRSVGIDLSEKYLKNNAVPRVVGELTSRPALALLAGVRRKPVVIGRKIT